MTKRILVVDDEPDVLALVEKTLSARGFHLSFAAGGEEALTLCDGDDVPDLILLDVMMPGMSGVEVCRTLKAQEATKSIPVIFVTARGDVEDESVGFEVGGVDYIAKPISPAILVARVRTHLSLIRAEELEELSHASIFMLGQASHYHDTDTGVHVWRMADYSAELASAAGWELERVEMMRLAASLHDTGKTGIPDSILQKPGKLDADEWRRMKHHSKIGWEILSKSKLPIFQLAAQVAHHHHEWWNGSGYPEGLSGEDIPESARIVAVADVFDALTMKRPYKEAWSVDKAFEHLAAHAGDHFDPRLVDLFFDSKDAILKLKRMWDARE